LIVLGIIFSIALFSSLFIGRYNISPIDIIKMVIGINSRDTTDWRIFYIIRLPRVLLVTVVGMALSSSGNIFQSMFRNPLVSPNILGVSAGCSFGAALGIVVAFSFPYSVEILAFCFGLIAVTISYLISKSSFSSPILLLILAGIIVSSFFNALISFLQYIADPYSELPSIVFWIMGGFFKSTWYKFITTSAIIIPILIIILLLSNKLNILSTGDDEAQSLGLEVNLMRKLFIFLTTVMVSVSVSVSGSIAWIGLIIPHISRIIVGSDNRINIPASMLIGATVLLISDDIARTLTASEIPIGILISFIGAPFFGYLLIKTKIRKGFSET
ncbi:MAG: FecCD family ABC transporter permease, partial [Spirochaetota bacterium]